MKLLVPLLTLFLASCSVHNHRYDAEEDVYYQDDYYAYDNHDPYYGYGSGSYSTIGDGVYYNNYNYYPDRWGLTYSNVYYSPYRYPRVGFYFSSSYNCGYSYWSNWCGPGFWSPHHRWYNHGGWYSWGFGLGYSSFYYDNYWWYNHWRNRNYYHPRPSKRGYYSARNEVRRLQNNRYKSTQYRHNQRNGYRSNRAGAVSRERSGSNRSYQRAPSRSATRSSSRSQSVRQAPRTRQQSAHTNPNQTKRQFGSLSARQQVQQNSRSSLQERVREDHRQTTQQTINRSRYQQPVTGLNRYGNNTQSMARSNHNPVRRQVKPMNSQSPVYHSNTQPLTRSKPAVQPSRQRAVSSGRSANNRPVIQNKPAANNRAASHSKPTASTKSSSHARSQTKSAGRSRSSDPKTSDRSRQR